MTFDYPTNLLNHWMPLGCEWVYFLPSSHNDMNTITTLLFNAWQKDFCIVHLILKYSECNTGMCAWSLYHLNVKKNLKSSMRKCFPRNQTRMIFRYVVEKILLYYSVLSYEIIFIIFFERSLLVTDGRILFHDLLHVDIQKRYTPYNQGKNAFDHYM